MDLLLLGNSLIYFGIFVILKRGIMQCFSSAESRNVICELWNEKLYKVTWENVFDETVINSQLYTMLSW